jgi:hypothetical protein
MAALDISDFFTEYNDSINGDSNTDPLGLTVIWAALGQHIFSNRISSISNDVRSYTLNLFHHYIVRTLIADTSFAISYAALGRAESIDSLAFKNSCLIHLENLFVYAMVEFGKPEKVAAVQPGGVTGIANGSRKWHENAKNPELSFGHAQAQQILRRQLLLGVSGRYKTPMIEMKFFDRGYRYQPPGQPAGLWDTAKKFVNSVPELAKLEALLLAHFSTLLQRPGPLLSQPFDKIAAELKLAYVEAFRSPGYVGAYARDFWLRTTGLRHGIAGALLDCLGSNAVSAQEVFGKARDAMTTATPAASAGDLLPIHHIEQVEPFMADLDLLFALALRRPRSTFDEIEEDWQRYGRNAATLPLRAAILQGEPLLLPALHDTGRGRLKQLLAIARCTDLRAQLDHVLEYHAGIMQRRGQTAWLSKNAAGQFAVSVRNSKPPAVDKRLPGSWVHSYYITEFRNFAAGLRGATHETA